MKTKSNAFCQVKTASEQTDSGAKLIASGKKLALGQAEAEETAQALALARQECADLFGYCAARAEAAERAQEAAAQSWAERQGLGRHNRHIYNQRIYNQRIYNQRLYGPAPAPLYAGLYTRLGRAVRHWDTPDGRLLVTVRLAEQVLLPSLRAGDAEGRDRVHAFIAEALGLSEAAASGQLLGYVVCWQQTGRWPRRPVSVRLLWPGGKKQGDSLLGDHGPVLAELIAARTARPWTHLLNGRPMPFPPPALPLRHERSE